MDAGIDPYLSAVAASTELMERMTVAIIGHSCFGPVEISFNSGTLLVGTPGQVRFCVKRFHTIDGQMICGCQDVNARAHSVLFTGAIEIVNTLTEAHASGSIKRALNHYIKPQVLCIDELGYLPTDKFGADCLFQILSHRYERGATLITTKPGLQAVGPHLQ